MTPAITGATVPIEDATVMVFLPYTPRADSLSRGYHAWLRETDNPFFNSISGILHYSNWLVTAVHRGLTAFTHFDFMLFASREDTGRVWSNPQVVDFAANWTRTWGIDPDGGDLSVNYHSYLATRTAGQAGRRGDRVLLGLQPGGHHADAEYWKITEPLVGRPDFTGFCLRFGAAADAVTADWAATVLEGSIIAAPNMGSRT